MKDAAERMYRLTAAGRRALEMQRSVPTWYRSILWLVQGEPSGGAVRNSMYFHPAKQVYAWLDELETLGFVEPRAA